MQPDFSRRRNLVSIGLPVSAFAAAMHGCSFAQTSRTTAGSPMASSRIELVARRQEDLRQGHLDSHVCAGQQLVGRIYHTHFVKTEISWFWRINSLTVDLSVGAVMSVFARDLLDAKASFGRHSIVGLSGLKRCRRMT